MVDVQKDMLEGAWPVPSGAQVRPLLESLVAQARAAAVPVVWVQNDGPPGEPDEPGTPGWDLALQTRPVEAVLHKAVGDVFGANPGLAASLREQGISEVVVAGMQSEYCIDASARGALAAGFAVTLVEGGHATYDDGRSATEISRDVERALSAAGVAVRGPAEVFA